MFEEISRGLLPDNYYRERLVYKRKPPPLRDWHYPNKIQVDGHLSYAIVVKKTTPRLHDIYTWMSTHPYVVLIYTPGHSGLTGNIVVEAYESLERNYAMVTFRAATADDEGTNRIMQSHGDSARRGPCPPPTTGLLCRSGTNLNSVWQWLSIHRGRLAYLVNEPLLTSVAATVHPPATSVSPYAAPRRLNASRDSVDSSLPVYEPPPPSLHASVNQSIREEPEDVYSSDQSTDGGVPPPYWEIARQTEYGRVAAAATAIFGAPTGQRAGGGLLLSRSNSHVTRTDSASACLSSRGLTRTFTQSMPSLLRQLEDAQAVAAAIEDSRRLAVATASTSTNANVIRFVQQSVASSANVAEQRRPGGGGLSSVATRVRMARLSAKTNPEYSSTSKKHSGWLWRFLNM
ncbi:hypothetical protein GGI20_003145 [Coemansia sp. BCRC 34301]|nr:hypothetical protein GGI20_003145 [Coemansia sp. BCRC 34301]